MKKLTAAGQPWEQGNLTHEEELQQAIDEVCVEAQKHGLSLDDVRAAFAEMAKMGEMDITLMKECAIEGLLQASGGAECNEQGPGKGTGLEK